MILCEYVLYFCKKSKTLGIIKTQTIIGSIFTYLGVGLGLVTNIFLFAWFFSPEQVGLLGVILSYSLLFSQLANLGFDNVTIRLFPFFRTEDKKHKGYINLMIKVGLIGTVISTLIILFIKPVLFDSKATEINLLSEYWYFIPITSIFLLFYNLFDAYSRMIYKTVLGTILKEFVQRILIIIAISFFIFKWVDFHYFTYFYFLAIGLPTFILLFLLYRDGDLWFGRIKGSIDSKLKKSMISVSAYGLVAVFSANIILNIDRIMIERMIGMYDAGIYTVTFFFGLVILMPSRSLGRISATLLSDSWKNNDLSTIKDIYYKSCINQSVFAILLFIGIWSNIHNLFEFLPDKYEAGKWVIFWICIGSVIDMTTGINGSIIGTSKYYKMFTWFMLIFVVIIIVSNFIFIPLWGITGAAFASAISTLAFNVIRYIFILYKYNLQPFNIKYLYLIIISALVFLIGIYFPVINPFWLDLIIRSSLISLTFIIPIYYFKISPEINISIKSLINKALLIIKRI